MKENIIYRVYENSKYDQVEIYIYLFRNRFHIIFNSTGFWQEETDIFESEYPLAKDELISIEPESLLTHQEHKVREFCKEFIFKQEHEK